MNANELADELSKQTGGAGNIQQQAATMLRQQQAEIEELKQIIDANNLSQNIGQFVKPTNEPVAWMDYLEFTDVYDLNVSGRGVPLYTHPVELTDEEIIKVYEDMLGVASARGSAIDFARAILRKARNNG